MSTGMSTGQIQPKLIIHGGAGSSLKGKGGAEAVRRSLYAVINEVYALLQAGQSAQEAVIRGVHPSMPQKQPPASTIVSAWAGSGAAARATDIA